MNNLSLTGLVICISLWTIDVNLLVNVIELIGSFDNDHILIWIGIQVVFMIPIIVCIPLAIKTGDSMLQIVLIATYIRVFYDYYGKKKGILSEWETSNHIMSPLYGKHRNFNRLLKLYNLEYTALSGISLIISLFVGIVIYVSNPIEIPRCCLVPGYAVVILVTIVIIWKLIAYSTSIRWQMQEAEKDFIDAHCNRALELGLIRKKEIKKIKGITLEKSQAHGNKSIFKRTS